MLLAHISARLHELFCHIQNILYQTSCHQVRTCPLGHDYTGGNTTRSALRCGWSFERYLHSLYDDDYSSRTPICDRCNFIKTLFDRYDRLGEINSFNFSETNHIPTRHFDLTHPTKKLLQEGLRF